MTRVLQAASLLLGLPAVAVAMAQPSCPGCVIGVYDSSTRQNAGFWDTSLSPLKEIFVSIDYDPASGISGLSGIELSISGLPSAIPPSVEWFATASVSGDTTGTAEGGWTITWNACLAGDRNLGKITLVSVAPVGFDRVIRVLHRFPPTNPSFPFPAPHPVRRSAQFPDVGHGRLLRPQPHVSFLDRRRLQHIGLLRSCKIENVVRDQEPLPLGPVEATRAGER